jgi:hypothetical protein
MRTVTRDGEVIVIDNYNPPVSLRMPVSEAATLRDGIEAAIMDYDARQEVNIEAQHSGCVAGGQGTANIQNAPPTQIVEWGGVKYWRSTVECTFCHSENIVIFESHDGHKLLQCRGCKCLIDVS